MSLTQGAGLPRDGTSPVEDAITRISLAVDGLHARVDRLSERLAPVLIGRASDESEPPKETTPACRIEIDLNQLGDAVDRAWRRLDLLMEGLRI